MANLTYVSTKKLIDLLSEADPARALSVKIISTSRLALGTDPLKPTKTIDLSKEKCRELATARATKRRCKFVEVERVAFGYKKKWGLLVGRFGG